MWFGIFQTWFDDAIDHEHLMPQNERLYSNSVLWFKNYVINSFVLLFYHMGCSGMSPQDCPFGGFVNNLKHLAADFIGATAKASPSIGEFIIALLRCSTKDSLRYGFAMCNFASVLMAQRISEWGVDLELEHAAAARTANQPLDGALMFKIIDKIWTGECTMEEALRDAGLNKSMSAQIYKAQAVQNSPWKWIQMCFVSVRCL